MKTTVLILFILFNGFPSKSQIKALTENGRQVQLYENGTWKYLDSSGDYSGMDSITTNPHFFGKTSLSTFLVKSNHLNVGVFINPKNWTFYPRKENETNPEYHFSLKSGQGYGMMITEKTPVELESLANIALINAQKAAADAKIVSKEYRTVNNKKVLCLQMTATIQGIKFVYLGYYYSNENGTVQLLSYSSQKLFSESQAEMENFLNGLTVLE